MTVSELIYHAAKALHEVAKLPDFTKEQLCVAAWQLDPQRVGLAGFESLYPDMHRIYSELCGAERTKRHLWITRCGCGKYRFTGLPFRRPGMEKRKPPVPIVIKHYPDPAWLERMKEKSADDDRGIAALGRLWREHRLYKHNSPRTNWEWVDGRWVRERKGAA